MEQEELENFRKNVESIIKNTFIQVKKVYDSNVEGKELNANVGSRLLFPLKRDNSVRVSEQELRFLFIEELNKYCTEKQWNAYYSIETPTKQKYIFVDNPHECKDNDKEGQSAMFDVVLYDGNRQRICGIEFKAHNPQEKFYTKDFVKLKAESENLKLKYFVQIFSAIDQGTAYSVYDKINKEKGDVEYRCVSLDGKVLQKYLPKEKQL